jgi:hypothetical protein
VTAIAALTAARWLEFDESRQTARATAAGWSVVARLERPVGYADGWNIFAPPRDFDPDQVAMGGSAGADRVLRPRDKDKGAVADMHDEDDLNVDMTPEERAAFEAKIEASINTHSGHPTVTVQEWASLVRCRADRPVPVDELIASMYRWFVPVPLRPGIRRSHLRPGGQGLARHHAGRGGHALCPDHAAGRGSARRGRTAADARRRLPPYRQGQRAQGLGDEDAFGTFRGPVPWAVPAAGLPSMTDLTGDSDDAQDLPDNRHAACVDCSQVALAQTVTVPVAGDGMEQAGSGNAPPTMPARPMMPPPSRRWLART